MDPREEDDSELRKLLAEVPAELRREFEIEGVLGRGNQGLVVKAVQKSLERPVVIKLLRATDEEARSRFLREADLLSRIRHPRVIRLYDMMVSGTIISLVLEQAPGETLATRIARGDLDLGAISAILHDMLVGLECIHAHGIVHRDIKPSNVMVEPGNRARILDFGIARRCAVEGITAAGCFIGTMEYASPEQIIGEVVDPRSDLYSLGVVAYQLVTGVNPFHGPSTHETMARHLSRQVPSVPGDRLPVPRTLEVLIVALLRKERDLRLASAREALLALEKLHVADRLRPTEVIVTSVKTSGEPRDGTGRPAERQAAPARHGPFHRSPRSLIRPALLVLASAGVAAIGASLAAFHRVGPVTPSPEMIEPVTPHEDLGSVEIEMARDLHEKVVLRRLRFRERLARYGDTIATFDLPAMIEKERQRATELLSDYQAVSIRLESLEEKGPSDGRPLDEQGLVALLAGCSYLDWVDTVWIRQGALVAFPPDFPRPDLAGLFRSVSSRQGARSLQLLRRYFGSLLATTVSSLRAGRTTVFLPELLRMNADIGRISHLCGWSEDMLAERDHEVKDFESALGPDATSSPAGRALRHSLLAAWQGGKRSMTLDEAGTLKQSMIDDLDWMVEGGFLPAELRERALERIKVFNVR